MPWVASRETLSSGSLTPEDTVQPMHHERSDLGLTMNSPGSIEATCEDSHWSDYTNVQADRRIGRLHMIWNTFSRDVSHVCSLGFGVYIQDSYIFHLYLGPNNYSLPGVLGKTYQSGKIQAPVYSIRGRSNIGAFCEDLAKVRKSL